jgi:hypothetical protein
VNGCACLTDRGAFPFATVNNSTLTHVGTEAHTVDVMLFLFFACCVALAHDRDAFRLVPPVSWVRDCDIISMHRLCTCVMLNKNTRYFKALTA